MLVAIEELDQRALDVMIPLVPGFEREVFKAPLRFLLRHLSRDNSAESDVTEVPEASCCG